MRWDDLFADLEARLEADAWLERTAEVAERTRTERAGVLLVTRLAGQQDVVRLTVASGTQVAGVVADIGADWVLLNLSDRARQALVPLAAVRSVSGLGRRSVEARTARRFGWGYAVRVLSRDRAAVSVTDVDAAVLTGTIDAVGADHLDLAVHPLDEPRRGAAVRAVVTVPHTAVALIESAR